MLASSRSIASLGLRAPVRERLIVVCRGTSSLSVVCSSWSGAIDCDAVLPFPARLRRFLSRVDVLQDLSTH
eukprot:9922999-Lingulodinium_polyedra.AAC.1